MTPDYGYCKIRGYGAIFEAYLGVACGGPHTVPDWSQC